MTKSALMPLAVKVTSVAIHVKSGASTWRVQVPPAWSLMMMVAVLTREQPDIGRRLGRCENLIHTANTPPGSAMRILSRMVSRSISESAAVAA